jgi:hypothetical protein
MDSSDAIWNSTPEQLSRLLDSDGLAGRAWSPEDLQALLRHQLAAPIAVDLASLGPALAAQLKALADAHGLLLKSFADLFVHPHPPLELLRLVKDFAKAHRASPTGALPPEVASVLYFAAIGVAQLRLGQRISSLPDEALRQGCSWALDQSWVDARTKEIFTELRQTLGRSA